MINEKVHFQLSPYVRIDLTLIAAGPESSALQLLCGSNVKLAAHGNYLSLNII